MQDQTKLSFALSKIDDVEVNNREWALAIWLAIFIVMVLVRPN